jgi:hypothetical protein
MGVAVSDCECGTRYLTHERHVCVAVRRARRAPPPVTPARDLEAERVAAARLVAQEAKARRRASFQARQRRASAKTGYPDMEIWPDPVDDRERVANLVRALEAARAKKLPVKREPVPKKVVPPRLVKFWPSSKQGTFRYSYKTPNGAVIKSRKQLKRIKREIELAKRGKT